MAGNDRRLFRRPARFRLLKTMGEPAVEKGPSPLRAAMDEAKAKAEHDAAVARG